MLNDDSRGAEQCIEFRRRLKVPNLVLDQLRVLDGRGEQPRAITGAKAAAELLANEQVGKGRPHKNLSGCQFNCACHAASLRPDPSGPSPGLRRLCATW